MSDPVSNAEIEDVLSSIRRLVSENATPELGPVAKEVAKPVAAETADHDAGAHDINDKLVLTPAFRVHEATDPIDAPHQEDTDVSRIEDNEDPGVPSEDGPVVPAVQTLHLTGALSVTQEDDSADEVASFNAETAPSSDVVFSHRSVNEPQVNDPEGEPDTATGDMDTGDMQTDETPGVVQAAVESHADDDPSASEGLWAPTETAEPTVEPDVQAVQENPSDDQPDQHAQSLDHRVAELEAAVNDSAVEFEPDLGDAVEDLGPGIFLRRRAEAETELGQGEAEEPCEEAPNVNRPDQNWEEFDAEVEAFVSGPDEIEGHAQPDHPADENPEDAILSDEEEIDLLDEDMLRDLVGRLVREELQGEVGEKITRNARRLVRREVERALTLKSLD